jgi:hypothetical protein
MTDRISSSSSCPDVVTPAAPEATHATNNSHPSEFREALRSAAHSLASGEASLDASVARLSHGRSLSPEELIALQATVYRYAAEVEMAAKLTDKLTGAVRTALTSQQ